MSEAPVVPVGTPDDIEIVIPFSGTREEVVEWIEKNLPSDFYVRVNVSGRVDWYR